MQKLIKPSEINGSVKAPASKSMMQRAIAAGLLAERKTIISNPTFCNDSLAAMRVATALGAKIIRDDNKVTITGGSDIKENILNCGESGLGIRMFTPIASTWSSEITLKGEGSLVSRPVSMIEAPLRELGIMCESNNGFPPITVKGPIKGGIAHIDGSTSSQMLTGFLMALPKAQNDSQLIVKDLKSKPYIDMTIGLLKFFNIEIEHTNYEIFNIKGNQKYKARNYIVEGDWSGAAFLLVAGAVGGQVDINFIDNNSSQADRKIIEAIIKAGAQLHFEARMISTKKNELVAFNFDATDCPDLFPPLVALAANCKGTTKIKGVSRLKHKESDRATVLTNEFSKMGIHISIDNDLMLIEGGEINGCTIDSNNDHRIAMAAAVAAINATSPILIEGAECTAKSYPEFFDDFAQIGGNC